MKKTISRIIDIVLGVLLAFMVFVQVSMLVSQSKPENYGVPSVFGTSFLYVATDSMEGDNPDSLNQGTGVIIKKDDPKNVKVGDVITFYYPKLNAPDTHRVVEIGNDKDGLVFYTRGDNLHAWSCPSEGCPSTPWESVPQTYYIGTVVSHSDAFGSFLTYVSPQAAGAAGKSAWLVPVLIIVPLFAMVAISVTESILKYKKEKMVYEEELYKAMDEAGIDRNDEKAMLLFEEKYNLKRELRDEMERAKEIEKKKLRKEMKKEEKRAGRNKNEQKN